MKRPARRVGKNRRSGTAPPGVEGASPLARGAYPSSVFANSAVEDGSPRLILQAEQVAKLYRTEAGPVQALRELSVDIYQGEFLAVMGPSGSGKTTLLNCLSGLDDIDSGTVLVEGRDIHRMSDAQRSIYRARKMGFIFQSFNLIPVFTAVENCELPLLLAGVSAGQARRRAERTLDRVGLRDRKDHRPNELSGGEQQRVTIARALAGSPSIVWADEPTGNLDSETAAQVMDLLVELNREGLTVVLVTHDAAIGALAGRLITMRDGAIEGVEAAARKKAVARKKTTAKKKTTKKTTKKRR